MPFTKSSILKSIKTICAKFDEGKPRGTTYKALKMDANVAGLIKYLLNEINGAEFSAFHVQKRTRVVILQGYFEQLKNSDLYTVIEKIADFLQNARSEVIATKTPSKPIPKSPQPKQPSFDQRKFFEAYQSSIFRVYTPPTSFIFRIGERSEDLLRLMKNNNAATASFLTAFTRFNIIITSEQNARAQRELMEYLNKKKLNYFPGVGEDPSRRWPGEPSFLILGLTLDEAENLGKACLQKAIIQIEGSGIPKLIPLPGYGL